MNVLKDYDTNQGLKISYPLANFELESKWLLEIIDDEIRKRFPLLLNIRNTEQAKHFIAINALKMFAKEFLHLYIRSSKTNKTIGYIFLDPPKETNGNKWMLEFLIDKNNRNRGMVTGCLIHVMKVINKYDLHDFVAIPDTDNYSSQKVLEKLNFTYDSNMSSPGIKAYVIKGTSLRSLINS